MPYISQDRISIHTLRMEGDGSARVLQLPRRVISIHTLRMEGDKSLSRPRPTSQIFQSTPSAWRVTYSMALAASVAEFQSTPSAWRVTSGAGSTANSCRSFQSTPSAWRVTVKSVHNTSSLKIISIHTLRMEGDLTCNFGLRRHLLFQSTPSAWRVTRSTITRMAKPTFQSTPSAWRVTPWHRRQHRHIYFNPHPPHGG